MFQNLRNSTYACKTIRVLDKTNNNSPKPSSEPACAIFKREKKHFSGKQNEQQLSALQSYGESEKRGFCRNLFARHFSNEDEEEEKEEDKTYALLQGPAKKLFLNSPGFRFCEQLRESNLSTADNSKNPSNRNSNDLFAQPKYLQSDSNSMEFMETETKSSVNKLNQLYSEGNVIPSPTMASQDVQSFVPENVSTFLSKVCMVKDPKTEATTPHIGPYLNIDFQASPSKNLLSESPASKFSRFSNGYERCEELGQGSFGKVYRCIGRIDGAEYAVKVIPQMKKGISRIDRAENEIRIHAALTQDENSYFTRYFHSWAEDGSFYLVMEYCPSSLKNLGPLRVKPSEPVLRNLLGDVCQGLRQLHNMNYAHLDIKPDNIMYSKTGNYKITDLGLARIADRQPEEDVNEGDSRYLAPEFLNDFANVTQTTSILTKADIFSLGVTVYELMIGEEMPKNGAEWHIIRSGTLPKLDKLTQYSDSFKGIVGLMMSTDPLSRPSAEEIISVMLSKDMALAINEEKAQREFVQSQMMETEAEQ